MSGHSHSHHHHSAKDHAHDHGHGGHCHTPKVNASNRWRVGLAALITGLFTVAEVAGGFISGSLALLADAGHMFTDFVALSMAWWAFRFATRPANNRYPYGFDRVTILVAFVNGFTLFLVAAWIIWEAFLRLSNPGDILVGTMLWVACGGLAVNLLVFWILLGADQENLNIRGAVLHVLGDLLGSAAAIVAALIILSTGWTLADPLLSVLVALLILRSAWRLMRDSAHVLMQGTPKGLDSETIGVDLLENVEGLTGIETIRIWSLTQERPILTLTAHISSAADTAAVSEAIKSRLTEHFHIDEVTLEFNRRL